MCAILHCICESIERDRVSMLINTWRIKQSTAKLAVLNAMYQHFDTSMITYQEDGGIDLWEELREFDYTPIMCANYPTCKTGIYYRHEYHIYLEDGEIGIEEEDPNDYYYFCWQCYKQKKVIKSVLDN